MAKNINCKCGKEWSKQEVEKDSTIHKIDSFSFRFLRVFTRSKSGFAALIGVNACPECRVAVRAA